MFKGLLFAIFLAVLAELLTHFIPGPIDAVVYAIVLGLLVGNLLPLPTSFQSGIKFSAKKLLPYAVVLLGLRLSFSQLADVSLHGIEAAVASIIVGLLAVWIFNRFIKLKNKTAWLIGFGTAVCGSSAIMAVSPLLEADESAVSLSISVVNLYGTFAIFIFPVLGHLLHMTAISYGIWAGASIQAVPQVLAAGYAFGAVAGQTAITVKLIRVFLLAPMLVIVSVVQGRRLKHEVETRKAWYRYIPPMIIGFVIMIVLNSFGWLNAVKPELNFICDFLIVITLVAMGLTTSFKVLMQGGHRALLLGLLAMLLVMAATYFCA